MRVTTIGLTDVDGYVICVILVAPVARRSGISKAVLARGEFAALRPGRRGAAGGARRARGTLAAWGLVALLLGPALLPHAGILRCCRSPGSGASRRCRASTPSATTRRSWSARPQFIANTMRYAALAALLDVAPGRGDRLAPAPRPGARAAVARHDRHGAAGDSRRGDRGRLPPRLPRCCRVPGLGEPLTSTWLILVIVYAVRRLPYAVRGPTRRSSSSPALEEAAQNLGPTGRAPSGASRCR